MQTLPRRIYGSTISTRIILKASLLLKRTKSEEWNALHQPHLGIETKIFWQKGSAIKWLAWILKKALILTKRKS